MKIKTRVDQTDLVPIIKQGKILLDDKANWPYLTSTEIEIELSANDLWELFCTKAHTFCSNNRELVEKSNWVGCFHCLSFFRSSAIENWEGDTALCPSCNIDAILPDESLMLVDSMDSSMTWSLFFLMKMQERWFNANKWPTTRQECIDLINQASRTAFIQKYKQSPEGYFQVYVDVHQLRPDQEPEIWKEVLHGLHFHMEKP